MNSRALSMPLFLDFGGRVTAARRVAAALWTMSRPPRTAAAVAAYLAVLLVAAPAAGPVRHAAFAIVVAALMVGGFIFNDCVDLEKDRIEHPGRPLPSGWISRTAAAAASVVWFALALGAATVLGESAFALVAADAALLVLYSWVRMWSGILGNMIVATAAGSLIALIGFIAAPAPGLVAAGVLVFGVVLSQEIVLDPRGAPGNGAAGMHSFAIVHGRTAAFALAVPILFALAGMVVALAVTEAFPGASWFAGFALPPLAVLGVAVWAFRRASDAGRFDRFRRAGRLAYLMCAPAAMAAVLPL